MIIDWFFFLCWLVLLFVVGLVVVVVLVWLVFVGGIVKCMEGECWVVVWVVLLVYQIGLVGCLELGCVVILVVFFVGNVEVLLVELGQWVVEGQELLCMDICEIVVQVCEVQLVLFKVCCILQDLCDWECGEDMVWVCCVLCSVQLVQSSIECKLCEICELFQCGIVLCNEFDDFE